MAMNAERDEVTQPVASKPLKLASSDDVKSELTTSDDEDFTLDSGAFGEDMDEDMNVDESPFNIVSSVGNFFGVNAQNQKAVEEVLDVCCGPNLSRLVNEATRTRITAASALGLILVLRKVARNRCISKSMTYHQKDTDTGKDQGSRTRSWWRKHPSKEEDDYSSSSSEDEFPSYLPTSITVKRHQSKKPTKFENSFSRSVSNPHYKVKLVNTESRLGYEMDNISRRSQIV